MSRVTFGTYVHLKNHYLFENFHLTGHPLFLFAKSGNSIRHLSTSQTTNNFLVKFRIKWVLAQKHLGQR